VSVWCVVLCRDFYCHSVGHYLGLDVHDTNTIGPYRTLESGVVLAIEPGLYIPDHPQFGPYAGIGVRIEDDVLITQSGCEVGVALTYSRCCCQGVSYNTLAWHHGGKCMTSEVQGGGKHCEGCSCFLNVDKVNTSGTVRRHLLQHSKHSLCRLII